MLARLAWLLTGLMALILAGCDSKPPDPYKLALELKPKAAPRCDAVFAAGHPAGTPAPGSVKGPAVTLTQQDYSGLEEKYRRGAPQRGDWYPYFTVLVPSRAEPKSADAVQAVVCVREIHVYVGIYQPGNIAAIRVDWHVRVIRWPSGELLASAILRGQEPLQQVTVAKGARDTYTGNSPIGELRDWLDRLIAR